MPHVSTILSRSELELSIARWAGRVASFVLAAATGFVMTLNSLFEGFHSAYLSVTMLALIALHSLRFGRFVVNRECVLYATFVGYMLLQLLWTDDLLLARNTLVPSFAFVLVLVQFCALVTYHDLRVALLGIFAGFSLGAVLYTLSSGFPFRHPIDFSYNAIASLYLFGLFIAMLLCIYARSKILFRVVALVLLLHVVATTSIKANLGIAIGAMAAAIFYFKQFFVVARRNAASLLIIAAGLAYVVLSNDALMEVLERGIDRVSLGIEVLQARENVPGYSAVGSRTMWLERGIRGWLENPLFGHGVEAFRAQFGITSHSTPTDLLYNSGLIGLVLFYSVFVSLVRRLWLRRDANPFGVDPLILGALVCLGSITLSGTMHYNSFLAATVGIASSLLAKHPSNVRSRTISG